jgi:hypothetical protein
MKDFERLLLLQWPVRCRQCHRRTYAGLPLASMLMFREFVTSTVRKKRDLELWDGLHRCTLDLPKDD